MPGAPKTSVRNADWDVQGQLRILIDTNPGSEAGSEAPLGAGGEDLNTLFSVWNGCSGMSRKDRTCLNSRLRLLKSSRDVVFHQLGKRGAPGPD